jgi:molecular chaperone DnaK (HSP70)
LAYRLGIDLGTTYSAAAAAVDGRTSALRLGNRSAVIPSTVFASTDGTTTVGDLAEQLASVDASRAARGFKRRVGDRTPIRLGESSYAPEALMACLVPPILARAMESHGGPPERVALTCPANWATYKRELLLDSVARSIDSDIMTLTEPEAAALYYAGAERIEEGETVAVYDLGGGTFDAAVLRRSPTGFEVIGRPEGVDQLGGIDFDAAVSAHANRFLAGALDALDPYDASDAATLARVRAACTAAKEALSTDTDVSIPIITPEIHTEVRLTRREFERMIRPSLADSIGALRRTVRNAGLQPADLSVVLLVGGSSRIPLVAQMVGAELGRPVAVDVHPKHAVALGAALAVALADAPNRRRSIAAGVGVSEHSSSKAPDPPATGGSIGDELTPALAASGKGARWWTPWRR